MRWDHHRIAEFVTRFSGVDRITVFSPVLITRIPQAANV
jgi:hypothetical protein